jgi:universal stress protein family protein
MPCGGPRIVMGTRGLGSRGNLFLGAVASKVVRLAQVPVTLVKEPLPSSGVWKRLLRNRIAPLIYIKDERVSKAHSRPSLGL